MRVSRGTPSNKCAGQVIRLPEVDMPPARVSTSCSTPAVVHSCRCAWTFSSICTKNMVEPYISMKSPGWRTPALNPSAQASTVPALTGIPLWYARQGSSLPRDRADNVSGPGQPRHGDVTGHCGGGLRQRPQVPHRRSSASSVLPLGMKASCH